jgi:ferredoxin
MTHYVGEECVKCKYTDCVEVCPVDCFYEGEDFLVIDPETCIDCGVCIPECPVDAIKTDENAHNDSEKLFWLDYNAKYTKIWNKISKKKDPLPEAEFYSKMKEKKHLLKEKT